MIEQPDFKTLDGGDILLFDTMKIRPKNDWGFLGWLTIGAMIAIVFYDVQRWRLSATMLDLLLPVMGLIVGVVLVRLGSEVLLRQRPLLHISSDRQWVTRYTPSGPQPFAVDSMTHVVFGMIDYPLRTAREGINVEAFALYLAQHDGTPIPVIDAGEDKMRVFEVGKALSKLLNKRLIQMGKGVQGDEDDAREIHAARAA